MKQIKNKFERILKPAGQPVVENAICKNCGTVFTGRFCPDCGQSVSDFDKPFGFIIVNFLGDFFAFDTRFFRTIKALIFNPGFLSKQFFEGKRAPYAPPIRIFIFTSFLMFLLLQWQTNRAFNETDQTTGDSTIVSSANIVNQIKTDSTKNKTIINDSVIALDLNPVIFNRPSELKSQFAGITEVLEKSLATTSNPEEKEDIQHMIETFSNPEMMINKILKLMSWAFFLLLPVFALILKLFYFRVHFIRHLIFSIYTHSFIFIVFIIIILFGLIFKEIPGWISFIFLLTIPVYQFLAMRNFFGQRSLSVLPRFIGVSVIYNLAFGIVILLVVLNAMYII